LSRGSTHPSTPPAIDIITTRRRERRRRKVRERARERGVKL
jgi:hypothetical protein